MLRQVFICCLLAAATLAGWVVFVPSAATILARTGLPDLIGVEIDQARDEGAGGPGRGPAAPARVVTAEVARDTMNDRIATIGDGRAVRSVEVRARAAGRVTEVVRAPGARVARDSVIARLDDRAERIALERAEIALADARDELDRIERLQSSGIATAVSARAAELALRSAELDLKEARIDLDEREIRAPIAGWLGLSELDIGDRISEQDVLATITDRSEVVVEFRVPERVIGQVAVGMPFEATPLALPDLTLAGEISAIDSTVDRASRTLLVQGRLGNAADRLRAGMAFSIVLGLRGDPYPAIDPLALQWSSEGAYVWAVEEGRAVQVPVAIRQRNADAILVDGPLAVGGVVVTEGVQALREGDAVELAGPAPAAAGPDALRADGDT